MISTFFLDKNVIHSSKPCDWFEKIPQKCIYRTGITAINCDRRYGKTSFIVYLINKVIDDGILDKISIYVKYISQKIIIEKMINEKIPEEKRNRVVIDIQTSENDSCYIDLTSDVLHIVDDAECLQTKVESAIYNHYNKYPGTWIILGTSYEGESGIKKSPFKGILEMNFVNTYEVVGKIPEEVKEYLPETKIREIEARQQLF